MRLGTVRRIGARQAFRQDGSQTMFLPAKDIGERLALPEWEKLARKSGPALDPAELAPPILWPGKFICAGLNYFTHAQEVGKEAPQYPTLFANMSNTLLGAGRTSDSRLRIRAR
jgi:acylpyruvate hydrolase